MKENQNEQDQQNAGQDEKTAITKSELSQSERFTEMVMKEFSTGAGELNLTQFHKKLCQNYFIKIDSTLKEAERKRMAKTEKNRDKVPVTWANVNMPKLALEVVAYARVGLDPMQPNHINIIPYKNNSTGKYDMGFIIGYRGLELKAKKYGLDFPDAVIIDLVYTKDHFKPIKKSISNKVESYEHDIVDAFDRGEIKGGFYYHAWNDNPEKNRLVVMTVKDIEKRKPEYASVEFWGGEKDKWEWNEEKGKNVKNGKEFIEGWVEEMYYKTLFRAAHNSITIDSEKIDDDYYRILEKERETVDERVKLEINENANKKQAVGFDKAENITSVEVTEEIKNKEVEKEVEVAEEIKDENAANDTTTTGKEKTLFDQTDNHASDLSGDKISEKPKTGPTF